MDCSRTRLAALLCALLLAAAGCTKTGPPVIAGLGGDTIVRANDSATYSCGAWDWGGGPVRYTWSSFRGELAWDSGPWVKWYAPESAGPAAVRVVVSDEDQETTTDSIVVSVLKVKSTLIDYAGAVKAGHWREWRDSLRLGYELEGRFSVDDSNQLAFLLLDSLNRRRWENGEPYNFLVELLFTMGDSFLVVVPSTGHYFFIVDNRWRSEDKRFTLLVEKTTP